jgi:acyl phosphate:glycerol-3-phosphate acyltransferase
MKLWLLSLSVAYLLGSIPFGYLLVRVFLREDVRQQGSGNIGATNVARSGGKWLGIATLALDLAKGYVAVAFARYIGIGMGPGLYDLAAVAAVVGHVFPVWLGFRGGKGVATALGVMLALAPLAALGITLVFLTVFLMTRYVSLGSIAGAICFPVFGIYAATARTPIVVSGFVFIAALVIAKHHANIARLLNGTESRFGSKGSAGKAAA